MEGRYLVVMFFTGFVIQQVPFLSGIVSEMPFLARLFCRMEGYLQAGFCRVIRLLRKVGGNFQDVQGPSCIPVRQAANMNQGLFVYLKVFLTETVFTIGQGPFPVSSQVA